MRLDRKLALVAAAPALVVLAVAGPLAAADGATPEELIAKVRGAAGDLAAQGEAGLAVYRTKNDTSVWKDSYVFVLDCASGMPMTAAHPVLLDLNGKPTTDALTWGPKPAAEIGAEMCGAGTVPGGKWIAYNLPKPGAAEASRKISYITAVPGTTWVTGAGIFDEQAQLADLDALAAKAP